MSRLLEVYDDLGNIIHSDLNDLYKDLGKVVLETSAEQNRLEKRISELEETIISLREENAYLRGVLGKGKDYGKKTVATPKINTNIKGRKATEEEEKLFASVDVIALMKQYEKDYPIPPNPEYPQNTIAGFGVECEDWQIYEALDNIPEYQRACIDLRFRNSINCRKLFKGSKRLSHRIENISFCWRHKIADYIKERQN